MNTMCQACDSEETTEGNGVVCKICGCPLSHLYEKRDGFCSLRGEYTVQCCKSCSEKVVNESVRMDESSPYATPLVSPSSSFKSFLSSYGSFLSSYGDSQADMSFYSRVDSFGFERTELRDAAGHNHSNQEPLENSEEHENETSVRDIYVEPYDAKTSADESRVDMLEKNLSSSSFVSESHEDSNEDKSELSDAIPAAAPYKDVVVESDEAENATDNSSPPLLPNFEADPLLWLPPEPEIVEDDMESFANNKDQDDDDDDECSDGNKWVRSSSLNNLAEEPMISQSYRDERQKAMLEAMNGQFKILVSRFLASEGITFSGEEGDQSWLNIVASLSWEAAQLVKPDASEGRAMDAGSYVKVKCVATGSRHQSQVIKGLVFKKNAAHKRMPTELNKPKLLLLQGVLEQSAGSLSSFVSMEQEKDHHLKSIIDVIDSCNPKIVLVEKTVSRDIQEALLDKKVTLVFDMKLHRLERIARCIASPIISFSDIQGKPKLKHCESFHIERIVEEHNSSGEGGKKPSKTLMFLEGFPKPLGCTILLKGSHSDELKKIKRVMQYTVFAAYHLILETSFFADQKIFSIYKNPVREGNSIKCKPLSTVGVGAANYSNTDSIEDLQSTTAPVHALDIPIDNGSVELYAQENHSNSDPVFQRSSTLLQNNSDVNLTGGILARRDLVLDKLNPNDFLVADSLAPCQPHLLQSTASSPGDKAKEGSLTSPTLQSVSSDFGFDSPTPSSQSMGPWTLSELSDHEKVTNFITSQGKPEDETLEGEKAGSVRDITEDIKHTVDASEGQDKDNIGSVLDPQSILILLSSQCITKQTICEQSHLSRIKYYGNFDVSLGRYMKDILLNQKHSCSRCGEPPKSHVYNYTHQNGNLTVLVRQLRAEDRLSGEKEGKIWMWTRCLRCKHESGIPRSTKRVVLSNSACSLSFGKFLELSFSGHSAVSRLSQCGHSLHRDCLRFFGLGSMIAMFKYSPVEIYTALKPPSILEFNNPKGREWLTREVEDVCARGNALFSEVSSLVEKLKPNLSGTLGQQTTRVPAVKELSEFEEMLKQEKAEFEAALLKVADSELLDLKWLNQELRFELYVWDQRVNCLRQNGQSQQQKDGGSFENSTDRNMTLVGDENLEASVRVVELSSSGVSHQSPDTKIDMETEPIKASENKSINSDNHLDVELVGLDYPTRDCSHTPVVKDLKSSIDQDLGLSASVTGSVETGREAYPSVSDDIQVDHSMKILGEAVPEKAKDVELKVDLAPNGLEKLDKSMSNEQPKLSEQVSHMKSELPQQLIWAPFSELRKELRKDLLLGSLQKFDFINSYTPTCLSPMFQSTSNQIDLLHFPVGPGGLVLTASVDEISSIIACALAISEDRQGLLNIVDKEVRESKATIHRTTGSISDGSMVSTFWSSNGSFESEGLNSLQSVSSSSSDEFASSTFDGPSSVDHLLASKNLHPEIPLGTAKVAGKCKFSVVCIHAKEFYNLRRKCCPSELAYISSLSRCKKWDAQGGKSKAFFAKSMDDRFIIKQIKKTELDSFLKFAPDYFKHVSLSMDSGSQTCLAKILGIYQVRQYRSGKETKFDVMVMENLLFGHTISRTYDLKGSVFSRYVLDGHDNEVFLDQNFVEDMRVSPIYIGGKTKHLLQRAIWNDTSFLTSINVMDYSLLVGVDKQRHEIVFGIIDYLRQYTWDKQLETWVKSSIVVPKNELPTVISPKEYKKRFRKFMAKYFLTVPDTWNLDNCLASCKFCIDDKRSSAKVHNAVLPEQPVETCT